MSDITRDVLADLALLSLVVAHGTDADLDPRETHALVEQVEALSQAFGHETSGEDLSDLVEGAVRAYGDLRVLGLDVVVERVGARTSPAGLARIHAALVAVAEADGRVHTMERTVLRHLAHAWRLD